MHIINNLKAFVKGFGYAFRGIVSSVKSERNMRVHLCVAFYVILFMRFYDLTAGQKCIVYAVIGLVISLELVNTAIEDVVDLCSPKYHSLAKFAKDSAAGAVLVSAIFAVVVAYHLFWNTSIFNEIFFYFKSNILMLILLLLSIVLCFLFIFGIKDFKEK